MKKQVPTFNSLDLAEALNANYFMVMHLIQNRESAWKKLGNKSFNLSYSKSENGEELPLYTLTKEQCFFIRSAFSRKDRKTINRLVSKKACSRRVSLFKEEMVSLCHNLLNKANRREKLGESNALLRMTSYFLMSLITGSSPNIQSLLKRL